MRGCPVGNHTIQNSARGRRGAAGSHQGADHPADRHSRPADRRHSLSGDVGDCCCSPHHVAAAGWIAVGIAHPGAGADCHFAEGSAAVREEVPPPVRGALRAQVRCLGDSLAATSPSRDDPGRSVQALSERVPPRRAAVLLELAQGRWLAPSSFEPPVSLQGLPRSRRPSSWFGCASWEPHRRRGFPPPLTEPVTWASAYLTQRRQSSQSSRVRLQRTTVFPPTQ